VAAPTITGRLRNFGWRICKSASDSAGKACEGGRLPNMSAETETEDPDFRVHAAWLAHISEVENGQLTEQDPKQGTNESTTSSIDRAGRPVGQEARVSPPSRIRRTFGLILMVVLPLLAVISFSSLFESWRQPTGPDTIGLGSSEPPASAPSAMQNELEPPKLIVEPSVGMPGEPAPLGLSLLGRANDAVVIIRSLLPCMELSAGSAGAGGTWQVAAKDLTYAWIAPPQDFVGSADLIAELQLPNAQIVDRQTIRMEWTQRAAGSGHKHEREQTTPQIQENVTIRQEIETRPPIAPPDVQHPTDRHMMTAAPTISADPSQGQLSREQGKSALVRGREDLRRSVDKDNRHAPLATKRIRDSAHPVRGFWDWSR
jgi:hypothetical protein